MPTLLHPQLASAPVYNGTATQPLSRPATPPGGPRQPVFEESQPTSRRASQANVIAPAYQIPKSVNASGGSLAELAARITCLFWFESAEILQAVEDSPLPFTASRQLVPDAKPNTGFRKWVTTILSTTLVAQNVVLLALLFIYRLKKLNPTVRGKPGSEYRLLTVALMLGNKFLDDNTYTNKTWAEVSGIVVAEVHIMEVEFLSNMKYCLFTSAEDWENWQILLGKFAAFFDRATRPQPPQPPAPILPPASSLHLPMALPSPPVSNQASPPYGGPLVQTGASCQGQQHLGPTPAPSPMAPLAESQVAIQNSRKRSLDEYVAEPPAKRIASAYQSYSSPSAYAKGTLQRPQASQAPHLPLPIPASTAPAPMSFATSQGQQLPPLNIPGRAMAMIYPTATTAGNVSHLPAPTAPAAQPASQYQSRQPSPYPVSAAASPTNAGPHPAVSLHPPVQVSPSYFLAQRNSPYRPIHNVSTLLYPPPSAALQHRPTHIDQSQMHYLPLSKSGQQRQTGRLPYVAQNIWLDQGQPMTPVHQWPGFLAAQQQQAHQPQYVPPQR